METQRAFSAGSHTILLKNAGAVPVFCLSTNSPSLITYTINCIIDLRKFFMRSRKLPFPYVLARQSLAAAQQGSLSTHDLLVDFSARLTMR